MRPKRTRPTNELSTAKPVAVEKTSQALPLPATGASLENRLGLPLKTAPHFIVGVGASAGGLEALGKLFASLPADSGLSFVVVQHLSPDYKSFMVELLSKRTAVPVLRAEDGLEVKPNHIYLIPPKKNLKIFQGRLLLVEPDMSRGFNLPIDVFFRSLAEEKQHQSIGIVLSGTGSDGTSGIRAIKDAGGMVLVQSEATAQFDGMPRSAIGTGLADSILAPEEMPKQLLTYLKHPFEANQEKLMRSQSSTDSLMHKIFALMREQCGVDFSYYKPSTIDRRIERRMSINQLHSLEEYYLYLQTSPREAALLFRELLICVTRFFRDREAFEFLEKSVIPDLCRRGPVDEPIRIWVPSCSTGEEAYSLAMLFADEMRKTKARPVKIFATDISKSSIDIASHGIYSESEVADVPPEKLQHYFTRTSDGWQVSPLLRQMVVFAKHDLLKDPPFTKLDFVSCRNVLIYFQTALQGRVISVFHFALKPESILFLGSSETVGELTDKFQAVSTRHKVYRTRPGAHLQMGEPRSPAPERSWHPEPMRLSRQQPGAELRMLDLVCQEIIADYGPACIVVDANNEVTHLVGKAGDYLRTPPGAFTRNVLKLTSHNLSVTLATLLHRVSRDNREHVIDNLRFRQDRKIKTVRLRVRPLRPKDRLAYDFRLVFIEPKVAKPASKDGVMKEFKADLTSAQRITDLEQELTYSKETLQATIEELETSNEELQAANEELLASNEELQSTNEELQSLNEELHTVNSENQNRIEELMSLTNDINNLLVTTRVATMLVDASLRIRRMSSALQILTGLTAGDIGAPLEVLGRDQQSPEFIGLAQQVLQEERTIEYLLPAIPGRRCLLARMAPYKSETNVTSGLVVTLIDMTETRRREAMVQSVIDLLPAFLVVTDDIGRIMFVNAAWTRFGAANGSMCNSGKVGDNYFEVCRQAAPNCPDAAACLAGFQKLLRGEQAVFEYEYPCDSPSEQRWFLLNASPMSGEMRGLVITHINITERKKQEAQSAQQVSLLQSARHAVVGCDLHGTVRAWNRGAELLLGWPMAEALGHSITEFTPPDKRADQLAAHAQARDGKAPFCQLAWRLTRHQSAIQVGVQISVATDAAGRVLGTTESLSHCGAEAPPPA